jgi:hypothetical protein
MTAANSDSAKRFMILSCKTDSKPRPAHQRATARFLGPRTLRSNGLHMGTPLFLYSEFEVRPLTDYDKYMENLAAALEKREG